MACVTFNYRTVTLTVARKVITVKLVYDLKSFTSLIKNSAPSVFLLLELLIHGISTDAIAGKTLWLSEFFDDENSGLGEFYC